MTILNKCSILGVMLVAGLLSGCANTYYPFLYRPTIEQGNEINQSNVQQLKVGMTQAQVQQIMGGNPVLSNNLNSNRWDYVYSTRKGSKQLSLQRVSLFFQNGILMRIQN